MDQDRIADQTFRTVTEGTIQPGSVVMGSDGTELGSVEAVTAEEITVKKKGLLGGHVTISRGLVRGSEEGFVELSVPAKEATRR